MFNWTEIAAKQEQYADLLRQAEKERLVRQLRSGQKRVRFGKSVVTWLLSWLAA